MLLATLVLLAATPRSPEADEGYQRALGAYGGVVAAVCNGIPSGRLRDATPQAIEDIISDVTAKLEGLADKGRCPYGVYAAIRSQVEWNRKLPDGTNATKTSPPYSKDRLDLLKRTWCRLGEALVRAPGGPENSCNEDVVLSLALANEEVDHARVVAAAFDALIEERKTVPELAREEEENAARQRRMSGGLDDLLSNRAVRIRHVEHEQTDFRERLALARDCERAIKAATGRKKRPTCELRLARYRTEVEVTPKDAYDARVACDAPDGGIVGVVRRPLKGSGECVATFGIGSEKPMRWLEVAPDISGTHEGTSDPRLIDYRVECSRQERRQTCEDQWSERLPDETAFSRTRCRSDARAELRDGRRELRDVWVCVEKVCMGARDNFAYPLATCVKNRTKTAE